MFCLGSKDCPSPTSTSAWSSGTPTCGGATGARSWGCTSSTSSGSTISAACSEASRASACWRSEEHTSELQSQSNLVCRLLLEKKKIRITSVYDQRILHFALRLTSHHTL